MRYLELLTNGEDPLLDPSHHDSLLSDDNAFSRSKTYFWCINLLRELSRNTESIISELDQFQFRFGTGSRIYLFQDEGRKKLLMEIVEKIPKNWVEGFRAKQKELNELREEAKALRDGVSYVSIFR